MNNETTLQKFDSFVKSLKIFMQQYDKLKKSCLRTKSKNKLKNLTTKIEQELSKVENELNKILELKTDLWEFEKVQARRIENEQQLFGNKLYEELKKIGIELKGQIPKLSAGLFWILVDFEEEKAQIWYGPEKEFVGQVELDPKKIAAKIKETKENLSYKFSEKEFFEKLKRAYQIVVHNEFDKPAPIIKVLYQLALLLQGPKFAIDPKKENYFSYGRMNFSYDLYRLQKSTTTNLFNYQIKLETATRAQTKERTNFLWVPTNETGDGIVYSSIKIKEKMNG